MRPYIFNIDKPTDMTSYDVIRYFKKNLPQNFGKIGHFGTLDPFASGVLLIAIGGASRINEYVHDYLPKTYLARGELGVKTDSGDMTTAISAREEDSARWDYLRQLSLKEIREILLPRFAGEYWQVPPAYSAVKHEGQRLHKLAREGTIVVKDAKKKFIHSLEIVSWEFPYLEIRARVSSGTYIRTLFENCAEVLGTLGTLHTLRREGIGHLMSTESLPQELWPVKGKNKEGKDWFFADYGLTLEKVLPLQRVALPFEEIRGLLQGRKLQWTDEFREEASEFATLLPTELLQEKMWLCSPEGKMIGMGEKRQSEIFPLMNFYRLEEHGLI